MSKVSTRIDSKTGQTGLSFDWDDTLHPASSQTHNTYFCKCDNINGGIGVSWGTTLGKLKAYEDHGNDMVKSITIPKGTYISEIGQKIEVPATIKVMGKYTVNITLTLEYVGCSHNIKAGWQDGHNINSVNIFGFQVKNGRLTDPNDKQIDGIRLTQGNITDAINTFIYGSDGPNAGTEQRILGIPQIPLDSGVSSGIPFMDSNQLLEKIIPDLTVHCFLSGTLIRMDQGLKKVETIQVGDHVQVLVKDSSVTKKVVSVRKSLVTVCHDDKYPVCIKKDAFADNVPFQDLYVTSEHCLYVNQSFVPVRMFVNGSSVTWNKNQASYYVYHIETEEHAVIESNGLYSESFLNNEKGQSWEKDAAAPLRTDRAFVEPIYKMVDERATIKLGLPLIEKHHKVTHEADFHIVTDKGEILYPFAINKGRNLFTLPENTEEVTLVSRASRPYDVIGSYVDDRRYLGVLIGQVFLINDSQKKSIDIHLQENKLSGWNNFESSSYRWTNGNATLPLGESLQSKTILVVQVIQNSSYVCYDNEEKVANSVLA